jgi:hypothetical protein
MKPCSLVDGYQCFEGTCCLYFQGSSEISLTPCHLTRCHGQQCNTPNIKFCVNVKTHIRIYVLVKIKAIDVTFMVVSRLRTH